MLSPDETSAERSELDAIRAAFHVLEEGVIVFDTSGSVVAANAAAARTLGVPLDTVLGGDPSQAAQIAARFGGGAEVTPENSVALRVLRTGTPERGLEVRFTDPATGEQREIRVSVQPLFREGEDKPWAVVGSFVNVTEREQELAGLAFRDSLTGLANRRLLEEHLGAAVARARRKGSALGLVFFDLDGLKEINDSLGHAGGDEVLRVVAERLRDSVRETDTAAREDPGAPLVGRLGGDEFLILLADIEEDPAEVLARVHARVGECLAQPFEVAGREVRPTASFGMSLYPRDGETPEALLAHADAAMYAMKRGRRSD